jgi:hypothetical protein
MGLFTAATPHLLIALVLLVSGCLRSLQFTALQAMTFADLDTEHMSQGASISSMVQRLAQSIGIAFAAYVLELSSLVQDHATIVAADFLPAFIVIALVSLVGPIRHRRLPADAGAAVSGQVKR